MTVDEAIATLLRSARDSNAATIQVIIRDDDDEPTAAIVVAVTRDTAKPLTDFGQTLESDE